VPIAITGDANGPVRVTVEFAPVGENGAVEDVDYIATSKVINISEEDKEANVEIYTVPNDVEDDTKSFTVTITNVDGAALGESYVTTVTLVDNDVVIPAEWEDLGMCTYTEVFFNPYIGTADRQDVSYKVELQRNAADPSEYRLVNPYGEVFYNAITKAYSADILAKYEINVNSDTFYSKEDNYLYFYMLADGEGEDMTLDTEGVYIPEQKLPVDWGDGDIVVMTLGYYYVVYGGYDTDTVKGAGYFGTYKNGVVKFNANSLLTGIGDSLYYANYNYSVNWVVEAGVSLGDYSASIDYLGLYSATTGDHKAVLSVTTGKDVKSAKVACSTGGADALVTAIKDGKVKTVTIGGNTNETVTLDIESEGTYSFAVVTYDASSAQESATTSARISFGGSGSSSDDSADWTVIGYADYQDGWVIPAFQLTSDGGQTYEPANAEDFIYTVQVKESKSTPGVYKIVAPYGEDFPMYSMGLEREDINNTDLIFDASDPTCVIVDPQYSGFTMADSWGEHYVLNIEGYYRSVKGYNEASAIHAALNSEGLGEETYSTLEDGVITIPIPWFANNYTEDSFSYWKNLYPTIVYLPIDQTRSAAPANVKSFAKMKAAQKAKVKAKFNAKTGYKKFSPSATGSRTKFAKITSGMTPNLIKIRK
jgi:hypothetical protein